MKQKFNPVLSRFWRLNIYTLALFPIFPRGVQTSLVISLLILSIFLCRGVNKNKKTLFNGTIFSSIFIIYLISLIYTNNIKEGLLMITRTSPFLAFPLIFAFLSVGQITTEIFNKTTKIFTTAVFLKLLFTQLSLLSFFENKTQVSKWDYRKGFELITDVHGTYFSLWIGFASLFLLSEILKELKSKNLFKAVAFGIIISYFFYWQATLEARIPLIATLILSFVLIVIKTKKVIAVPLFGLIIAAFYFVVISQAPNYFNKTKKIFEYDFSLPKGNYNINYSSISNFQIRNGIYLCSFEVIKKSWLFGYGVGDTQDQLRSCYEANLESNVYEVFTFNSHNQYLQVCLSSGIFGLIIFLYSQLSLISYALRNSDTLFLFFLLLCFFCLLSENIFSRHDGVIFYTFIGSMMLFKNEQKIISTRIKKKLIQPEDSKRHVK